MSVTNKLFLNISSNLYSFCMSVFALFLSLCSFNWFASAGFWSLKGSGGTVAPTSVSGTGHWSATAAERSTQPRIGQLSLPPAPLNPKP